MKILFYSKKLLICQIYFLAVSCFFTSCNNDDPEIEDSPTLGYFEGTINGKHILLEEKSLSDMILLHDYSIWAEDTIACYGFAINIPKERTGSDNIGIYTYLSPLSRQLYEIGSTYNPDLPFTEVTVSTDHKRYKPSKTPFKIEIETIITHKDDPKIIWSSPRVTGIMEGVFYNVEDVQDSIVIKNVKFRVWNRGEYV